MTPDALLFISPGCPHCPSVLQALSDLVKESLIGRMTVVNVAVHPKLAEEHGVRAAPWLNLGPYTFTGAMSTPELRQWALSAYSPEGSVRYVEYLLKQGGYRQAAQFISEDTSRLMPLLSIVANPSANLEVRLGASALLESYAGKEALIDLLPHLSELARHEDYRVRADACHLLGMTGSFDARAPIASCLDDANAEVREIAADALAGLDRTMKA